jgi:hypothetical protein
LRWGPAEGHGCLAKLAQGTVCKILNGQEVKPHKARYYLERRDPEFKAKTAEVVHTRFYKVFQTRSSRLI